MRNLGTKPRVVTLFLWVFLAISIGLSQGDLASQIYRKYKPSVVQILSQTGRDRYLVGTGVIVRANGTILTCYHVIRDSARIQILMSDGAKFDQAQIVSFDERADLALIKVQANALIPVLLSNASHLVEGQDVFAIGHPQGFAHTISSGIISGIREANDGSRWIQITNPISEGSSGGPLFNRSGQVIGLTVGSWKFGQNINFAATVDWAITRLRDLVTSDFPVTRILLGPRTAARELSEFGRGMELLRKNEAQEARELFTQLITANPHSPKIYFGLGLSWSLSGEDGRVSECFQLALSKTPVDDQDFLSVARIRFIQGNYEAALFSAGRAIELNPRNPEAHLVKGASQALLGRMASSYDSLLTSIRLQESAVAYFLLGLVEYYEHEDYAKAARDFKQSLRFEPDDGSAHYYLGLCYDRLDLPEGVQREIEFLKSVDPGLSRKLKELVRLD